MGISVFFLFEVIYRLTNSNAITTIISVGFVGIIYISLMLLTRGLLKEDLLFIKGSGKWIDKLIQLKLVREKEQS